MPRLSNAERQSILHELQNGGSSPVELQTKYNISKQSLYALKKKAPLTKVIKEDVIEDPNDAETLMIQQYDPENMKDYLTHQQDDEPQKPPSIPKSLIKLANKKLKDENDDHQKLVKSKASSSSSSKKGKTPEDEEDEEEEIEKERKKLILNIRQYIFAFPDNITLQEYVGDNKDKYLLSLEKKSIKDLKTIFEYIKFHVRNKGGNEKVLESSLVAMMIVIEKVGTKVGFHFDGLAKEISDDLSDSSSDLKRTLIELSIEMDISKYTNSPKIDLLTTISQKLLFTHTKNKELKKLQKTAELTAHEPAPVKSTEAFLKTTYNPELAQEFGDL